ncbi:unnamed protein product [Diplocarpon coronariae]
MQFFAFFIIATILAVASVSTAQCKFHAAKIHARCAIGENLFCKYDHTLCPLEYTQSFNSEVTLANEESCFNKTLDSLCTYVICCT